jgi:hypothetical protein
MGFLGKSSSSNPLNRRMWTIPESSTSTKTEQGGSALVACGARVACPEKGTRTWLRKKSHRPKTSRIGWGVEERLGSGVLNTPKYQGLDAAIPIR